MQCDSAAVCLCLVPSLNSTIVHDVPESLCTHASSLLLMSYILYMGGRKPCCRFIQRDLIESSYCPPSLSCVSLSERCAFDVNDLWFVASLSAYLTCPVMFAVALVLAAFGLSVCSLDLACPCLCVFAKVRACMRACMSNSVCAVEKDGQTDQKTNRTLAHA